MSLLPRINSSSCCSCTAKSNANAAAAARASCCNELSVHRVLGDSRKVGGTFAAAVAAAAVSAAVVSAAAYEVVRAETQTQTAPELYLLLQCPAALRGSCSRDSSSQVPSFIRMQSKRLVLLLLLLLRGDEGDTKTSNALCCALVADR